MLEKSISGDKFLPVGQYLNSVLEIAGNEIEKQVQTLQLKRSTLFKALDLIERYTRQNFKQADSVKWVKLNALVSLRLAMKHNDTQEDHFKVLENTSSSSQDY